MQNVSRRTLLHRVVNEQFIDTVLECSGNGDNDPCQYVFARRLAEGGEVIAEQKWSTDSMMTPREIGLAWRKWSKLVNKRCMTVEPSIHY